MAGWKIPELNGGFVWKITELSMVHVPASHGADDTGGYWENGEIIGQFFGLDDQNPSLAWAHGTGGDRWI